VLELASGDSAAAVATFRRALYADPSFGLAAFQLGCAHDACGDLSAARRAHAHSLRLLASTGAAGCERLLGQLDVGDVAAACRARLGAAA